MGLVSVQRSRVVISGGRGELLVGDTERCGAEEIAPPPRCLFTSVVPTPLSMTDTVKHSEGIEELIGSISVVLSHLVMAYTVTDIHVCVKVTHYSFNK